MIAMTEPLPAVVGAVRRQRAQMIAFMALLGITVFIPLSFVAPLMREVITPATLILRLIGFAAAVLVWGLARRGSVETAGWIFVAGASLIIWLIAVLGRDTSLIGILRTLDLFALVTLAAAIIMPMRRAVGWWIVTMLLTIAILPFRSDIPPDSIFTGSFLFNFTLGSVILIVIGIYQRSERRMRACAQANARDLQMLLNTMPDYIARMDADMRYQFVNPQTAALMGRSAQEMIGKRPQDLLTPEVNERLAASHALWKEGVTKALTTGAVQRVEIQSDPLFDDARWYDLLLVPEIERGTVLTVSRDITASKRAEAALRASRALIQRVIDTAPYPMYVFNRGVSYPGKMEFVNQATETFYGCPPGGGVNLTDIEFLAALHPDDLPAWKTFLARTANGEKPPTETLEVRMKRHDGEWLFMRCWLTRFETESDRVMGVMIDFTEERAMQTALLEAERERAYADAERGLNTLKTSMMIRIGDQFRNPLAAILSASELLERYLARMSDQQRAERFAQIRDHVAHLTRLLDDMHSVLRERVIPDTAAAPLIDLYPLCAALLAEMRARYHNRHITHLDMSETMCARIEAEWVRLVLEHLLSNAFLYTPPEGEITLGAQVVRDDLVLFVRDTGIGITDADGARIFEPFYRGSNIDERPGLGLGLSIVRAEVTARGGSIEVISDIGQGTTFSVRLPLFTANEPSLSGHHPHHDPIQPSIVL